MLHALALFALLRVNGLPVVAGIHCQSAQCSGSEDQQSFSLLEIRSARYNRTLKAACAPQATGGPCEGCGCCTDASLRCLCNPTWSSPCTGASEAVCTAPENMGQYCSAPGPSPAPSPSPSPPPSPLPPSPGADYQGQFMIPTWSEWKFVGAAGPIGICFGGGSDIAANTAAGCNPGGSLYQKTVELTASDGDKYYDFGGGDAVEKQWWTEEKVSQLNNYMDMLVGRYQGIFYDIETFEQNFEVDSMYASFTASFALAKEKGLKVIASTSYTAPYLPSGYPQSYRQLTDALWLKILGNADVDFFSPQFYGDGQTASITTTSGSGVSFSSWTAIEGAAGRIMPTLKAWSQEAFQFQVGQMEAKCRDEIGDAFCLRGYLLWGST